MEEIRYSKIKDSEEIFQIMRQIGRRAAYTIDLVKDLIQSGENSISLVLILNNKIIGALGARAEGKKSLWFYYIVIDKEHRKKGYGRKLMSKFFEEARKKGIKRVATDTPAKEFFENFGFKEVGKIPNWYEDKDQIIMYQRL